MDTRRQKSKKHRSYSPSINKRLVSRHSSRSRKPIIKCNNYNAFLLKEPIQISVKNKCYPYNMPIAQQFLLDNLRANKHLNPKKIITPVQSHSNCWFNTMFVTFFMSDKGRKFFHFFRQMMIEGKRANGEPIPSHIWHALALLNFAIEACLTGNEYAYKLNTNKIIHDIYLAITSGGENMINNIVDVDYANNPIGYYKAIMNYLNVQDIDLMNLYVYDKNWKRTIENAVLNKEKPPHIIVMEVMDGSGDSAGYSGIIHNKEKEFTIGKYKYALDSSVIRDMGKEHFCAMITCEGTEFGYDGASFHRLVPMKWKQNLNKHDKWKFKGTEHEPGDPLYWSFMHGYYMLNYYRVE
jgi:hypothetical protein